MCSRRARISSARGHRPARQRGATLRAFIEASLAYIAAHPANVMAMMAIVRAGRTDQGAPRFDPMVGESRRVGFSQILAWGQQSAEFRAFAIPVMMVPIIEALDAVPAELAANPDLDLAAYGHELAELFDRATRADVLEDAR